ncbi:MAG: hypothetical protein AB7G21_01625 [Dehalococcoidia bacterium]
MAVLSIGLVVGAVSGAFVAGGALDRGFPIEVALVRGAVAFMALAFVGYLGELVVVTAPPRERAADRPTTDDAKAPTEAPERAAAPRLIAAARSVDEDSNADDADVDVRQAA